MLVVAAQTSPNWKASTHWARSFIRIRAAAVLLAVCAERREVAASARREISESSTLPLPPRRRLSPSLRAPSQCDINNRANSTQLFAALLLLPQWPRALRPRRLHNNSPFATNLRTILCNWDQRVALELASWGFFFFARWVLAFVHFK